MHKSIQSPGRLLAAIAVATVLTSCGLIDDDDQAIVASGTIEAADTAVGTTVGGPVIEVAVDAGDEVAAGQILLRIDPAPVEAQIEEARAAVEAARAELDRVEAGPRPEEIQAAEAALSAALARWDGARRAWEAAAAAAQQAQAAGAVAESSAGVAAAAAGYRVAEAAAEAARADVDALRTQPTEAELASARSGLEQAEAALEAIESQREALDVRSPITGRVVTRAIEPGELAAPGAKLLRVADLSEVRVVVYLPEDEIGNVATGDAVEVEVDGFPDETFDGVVSYIASEAEFTPRNVQTRDQRSNLVFAVEIAMDNPRGRLRAGMPADVTFDVD